MSKILVEIEVFDNTSLEEIEKVVEEALSKKSIDCTFDVSESKDKKKLYSYDNCQGDKGVIIADSYEEAVELHKKEYPERQIAEDDTQYWNDGCYLEEVDFVDESKLYNTCPC